MSIVSAIINHKDVYCLKINNKKSPFQMLKSYELCQNPVQEGFCCTRIDGFVSTSVQDKRLLPLSEKNILPFYPLGLYQKNEKMQIGKRFFLPEAY